MLRYLVTYMVSGRFANDLFANILSSFANILGVNSPTSVIQYWRKKSLLLMFGILRSRNSTATFAWLALDQFACFWLFHNPARGRQIIVTVKIDCWIHVPKSDGFQKFDDLQFIDNALWYKLI